MKRAVRYSVALACALFLFLTNEVSASTKRDVTVVLVHGAFESGAVWDRVITILLRRHINVVAVQLPLTSLAADSANVLRVIHDQKRDVVLVGHSYGGTVITEAGNDPRVSALVYVAASSPDAGQSGTDEASPYPPPQLLKHLSVDSQGFAYATPAGMIDLGQDLPAELRAVLMARQGPVALRAFSGKVSRAAWTSKKTWSVIATQDKAISPLEEADRAKAIGAEAVRVAGSHSIMISHPEPVANVITTAVRWAETQP